MAIVTKSRVSKSAKSKTSRYIGKPTGIIQQRVETVGPSRFGIIAVDCAKQHSKWMLCDFFAMVLVEPTVVEHNAGSLRSITNPMNARQELLILFAFDFEDRFYFDSDTGGQLCESDGAASVIAVAGLSINLMQEIAAAVDDQMLVSELEG